MIILQFLLLAVGFVMLIKGADWFVDGAAGIAGKFGIPQLVIGLTIVAMGTSAPEAAVSITAALDNSAGITIGNVLGSNIINILIILGISSVIIFLPVQKSTIGYEIPFMIIISVVLLVMGITGNTVSRLEGVILWVLFIIYLLYLYKLAQKGNEEDNPGEQKSLPVYILTAIFGAVVIVLGSKFTVKGATEIARMAGITERVIGLTIVAFGTSLPELVTSIIASKKGNTDIAIGNIVGSNIFNILFVVGTSALITPVPFESKFIFDAIFASFAGVVMLLAVLKNKKLTRTGGILMLVCYAAYFVYLMR
ncbi:MAG: calcium/sodium antiporter [Lachnospiraceae bacterium]|nr:calcium/sodium antiporter [Lachnoclostridium sp.]MDD7521244.1 calcium/sodium antiporter [Lachnoclostridium sp.]MDY2598489.1 calcium/sodium antiporter [Lachnospiraceae bacterium]